MTRRTTHQRATRDAAAELIQYTPDAWTEDQLALHESTDLDDALYQAACLAGGWYLRPVTIDVQVTPENTERYIVRPAEVPVRDGWQPCYTITSHVR